MALEQLLNRLKQDWRTPLEVLAEVFKKSVTGSSTLQ